MHKYRHLFPFIVAALGIAVFSAMDAAMKSASLITGVYTAVFLRNIFGAVIIAPAWLMRGRPISGKTAIRVHIQRAIVTSGMAPLFFYGLVRIPLAETMAISFIAPLIALYFAALILKETIHPKAVLASLMAIVGIIVIGAGRFGKGEFSDEAMQGTVAILLSAVLYALNLVLQRKQAQLAAPVEIVLFQNVLMALILSVAAPWLFEWPSLEGSYTIALGALLASVALVLLAWAYARAEAQALIPIEYTGFLWAVLFGWLFFDETLTLPVAAGAALIVVGCWIATHPNKNSI